jgi:hypothetical protein
MGQTNTPPLVSFGFAIVLNSNPFPFPPMQNLKDLIAAAAIVAVAWLITVAVFSL